MKIGVKVDKSEWCLRLEQSMCSGRTGGSECKIPPTNKVERKVAEWNSNSGFL